MKRLISFFLFVIMLGSALVVHTRQSDQTRDALLKLTDQITSAKSKKDIVQIEKLLTDDFILTNPAGFVATRAEYLDGIKADTATYESVTNRDVVVSVYENAAVVTGSTIVKGRYAGTDIGGEFRFTNVFIKRPKGWQCVATQLTRVMRQ